MKLTKKLKHDIYIEAARKIAKDEFFFSCEAVFNAAISMVDKKMTITARSILCRQVVDNYSRMISPHNWRDISYVDFPQKTHQERMNHRTIALLMAAQMARTGDL